MLTGLQNRSAFLDRIADGALLRDSGTFRMVDLDHVKRINDTDGHQTGDLCLQAVADVIRDAAGDPIACARCGGEALGLFLPSGMEGSDLLAWRLAAGLTSGRRRTLVACGLTSRPASHGRHVGRT